MNEKRIAIIVSGITGSGKSGIVEAATDAGYLEIAPGKDFRKTHPGFTDIGQLCPDAVVNEYVQTHPAMGTPRLVFDGYPRTIEQAKFAVELLREGGYRIYLIFLRIGPRVAAERLIQRKETSVEERSDDRLPFRALVGKAGMQHERLAPALIYLRDRVDGRFCINTERNNQEVVRERFKQFYTREIAPEGADALLVCV